MKSRLIDPKELIKKSPILASIDLSLCITCKAVKQLCGHSRCPLLEALEVYPDITDYNESFSGNSVFGPVPQIFVGSRGYPRINTGPMTALFPSEKKAKLAGNPALWTELSTSEIINLRFGMLRGKRSLNIRPLKNESSRLFDQLQELTLSVNPVDTESLYSGKPNLSPKFDLETQPMGPSGFLQKLEITSNPKIPKIVDYIINDELKATIQMRKLYENNFDVYYLQNIFSSGTTGLDPKLVPTRWSITATDDIIGKGLIDKLVDFREISTIEVRQREFQGNYFTTILMPGKWSFENFETWVPGGIFTIKSETFQSSICYEGFNIKEYYKGRTSYASQAGGYYASRLAILEHLTKMKIQSRVVIIREISPEYVIPVGVWVVREGMRLTMKSNPIILTTKGELRNWLHGRLMRDVNYYFSTAQTFIQTSLDEFFKVK